MYAVAMFIYTICDWKWRPSRQDSRNTSGLIKMAQFGECFRQKEVTRNTQKDIRPLHFRGSLFSPHHRVLLTRWKWYSNMLRATNSFHPRPYLRSTIPAKKVLKTQNFRLFAASLVENINQKSRFVTTATSVEPWKVLSREKLWEFSPKSSMSSIIAL